MRRTPRRAGNREGPGRGGEPDAVPRPECDAEGLGPRSPPEAYGLCKSLGTSAPGLRASVAREQPARPFSSRHPSIPRVEQSFRRPRPADSQGGTESAVLPRILPQKFCYVMGINLQLTRLSCSLVMLMCSLTQINIIYIMGVISKL